MTKVKHWKPTLIKHSTISKLARWLREWDCPNGFFISHSTKELAKEMYRLNVMSYQAENKQAKKIKPFKFTNKSWPINDKGKAQAYRSLFYFLFNSMCGEASKTELYKKLKRKLSFLARIIAERRAIEQESKLA